MNWLNKGSRLIGYDENNEKMYSLTNGENLCLWCAIIVCTLLCGLVLLGLATLAVKIIEITA